MRHTYILAHQKDKEREIERQKGALENKEPKSSEFLRVCRWNWCCLLLSPPLPLPPSSSVGTMDMKWNARAVYGRRKLCCIVGDFGFVSPHECIPSSKGNSHTVKLSTCKNKNTRKRKTTSPDYWYFDYERALIHRFQYTYPVAEQGVCIVHSLDMYMCCVSMLQLLRFSISYITLKSIIKESQKNNNYQHANHGVNS